MSFTTMSVLVVGTTVGPQLSDKQAKVVANAGRQAIRPGEGRVEVERVPGDQYEELLALWLDSRLAYSAMMEILTPGSSPVVILVEDGKASAAAAQVQQAISHLRSMDTDWLTLRYREPDGTWSSGKIDPEPPLPEKYRQRFLKRVAEVFGPPRSKAPVNPE